jgi:hypothetical protein
VIARWLAAFAISRVNQREKTCPPDTTTHGFS